MIWLLGCAPSWEHEVSPLLSEHCASCHAEDTRAPFSLVKADTVAGMAPLLVEATAERRMPPWLADPECQPAHDAAWLSDEELALLAGWADRGAPIDTPVDVEVADVAEDLRADAVLALEHTPATSPDDYHCFLVDPGLDEDVFLTGYEVIPGAQVHHVILFSLDSEAAETQARALEPVEGAGYTCFGSSLVAESRPLAAWAPGTPPTRFPEGTGQRLHAGRPLVVQVHYYSEDPVLEATEMVLEWEPMVDAELFTALLGDLTMELEPGHDEVEAATDLSLANFGLPLGVYVRGVFPHMHRRGLSLHLDSRRGTWDTCLVDVPAWDFDWQRFYLYEEPVYLYPDEVLELSCTFDTSEDSEPVSWGEGTEDEMCLVGLLATLSD